MYSAKVYSDESDQGRTIFCEPVHGEGTSAAPEEGSVRIERQDGAFHAVEALSVIIGESKCALIVSYNVLPGDSLAKKQDRNTGLTHVTADISSTT